MKKIRIFSFLICIMVVLVTLCAPVLAVDGENADPSVTSGSHSLDAAVAYLGTEQRVTNVSAAVLYEMNSDTLMYAWNADQQVYPSSLVKIMTALIAVEKGNLEDKVTATRAALSSVPYYAASVSLVEGEQTTLDELLYCMMVGSANDAAAVIAEHISGSQEEFVKLMNQYAKELGCTGTQFANVHGLHDEKQYSTARDLARILNAAMDNPDFVTYFSAVEHTVPATNLSEARELSSGNHLMNTANLQQYYDSRVTGGRTGVADDDKRCLAASAESNGMKLLSVVVGCESTYTDNGNTIAYGSFMETSALLDAGFEGYQVSQVIYKDQALMQCSVTNGENDVILAARDCVYCVLPEGVTADDLRYQFTETGTISAPVRAGQALSAVQVWYGGACVGQAELVSVNSVPVNTVIQEDNASPGSNNDGKTVLIVFLSVMGCIAALALVLFFVRTVNITKTRNRAKRHSRDRRRSR